MVRARPQRRAVAVRRPGQRAGRARRHRVDRRGHLVGAARSGANGGRTGADRAPRAGHHGRRVRRGPRRPSAAHRPQPGGRGGAAGSDHGCRHRHHVHGGSALRATYFALDAGGPGGPAGAAEHGPPATVARGEPGRAEHHRQPAPRPADLRARPLRPPLPALWHPGPGRRDRTVRQAAAGLLLPGLPARTHPHRRRPWLGPARAGISAAAGGGGQPKVLPGFRPAVRRRRPRPPRSAPRTRRRVAAPTPASRRRARPVPPGC